jgi:hypothetical protein
MLEDNWNGNMKAIDVSGSGQLPSPHAVPSDFYSRQASIVGNFPSPRDEGVSLDAESFCTEMREARSAKAAAERGRGAAGASGE